MPYIMNCLNEQVITCARGKYFTWKPQEIKVIHNENLATFFVQNRGEEGLVDIPEHIMELDKKSPEYAAGIAEKRTEGIEKFLRKQNWIVRNLEMSLRRDYETSGQKGNFLFEASKGELEAYKNLAKYKEFEANKQLNVADEIQKLREKLYGDNASSTNANKVDTGRPNPGK